LGGMFGSRIGKSMIRFQCFKSPAEPNKGRNKNTLKNEPNPKNEHLTGLKIRGNVRSKALMEPKGPGIKKPARLIQGVLGIETVPRVAGPPVFGS
jgi:hypothetical protein